MYLYFLIMLTHSLYDHYCPWVMTAIGERTHRWFILFLFFTMQASYYYTNGYFKFLLYMFKIEYMDVPFSSEGERVKKFFISSILRYPIITSSMFWLGIIGLVLSFFFIQQFVEISRNETAIEALKLSLRKKKGQKYKNYYNKGFIQNWKSIIFPPVIKEHEPFKLEKNKDGKYEMELHFIDRSDSEYYEYYYDEYENDIEEEDKKDEKENKESKKDK